MYYYLNFLFDHGETHCPSVCSYCVIEVFALFLQRHKERVDGKVLIITVHPGTASPAEINITCKGVLIFLTTGGGQKNVDPLTRGGAKKISTPLGGGAKKFHLFSAKKPARYYSSKRARASHFRHLKGGGQKNYSPPLGMWRNSFRASPHEIPPPPPHVVKK